MRILILFSIVLLHFRGAAAQTAPLASEFQSWNEIQLVLPLAAGKDAKGASYDRTTLVLNGIARFGRNDLDFIDSRAGASIDFRVNKLLTLTTNFLYRRDEVVKNVRRYETRLGGGAVLSKTFGGVSVRNRSLFEHQFRHGRSDTNLYRNRTQINRPLKYKNKEIFTPFVSEEGYYDFVLKRWSRNEFYAGITRKINPKIAVDIAYIRLDTQPINVNGLSLTLRVRLK